MAAINKLTTLAIKNAKYEGQVRKLSDGKGMHLLVNSVGKYWHFSYRYLGKQKLLSLGVFPEVSLQEARDRRDRARQLIADGKNPVDQKSLMRTAAINAHQNTFEAVARKWHARRSSTWTEETARKEIRVLEMYAFPWIGTRLIHELTTADMLETIYRVEDAGYLDTAHRLRVNESRVFKFAIATRLCVNNPIAGVDEAVKPLVKRNFPAITLEQDFGPLLRDIWAYKGSFVTRVALKLLALTALRPGELRQLEWSEVDFENGLISLPAEKMKLRRPHDVPMSREVVALLKELHPLTKNSRYCFRGSNSVDRPMSENTLNKALSAMGYNTRTEHTAHGFRSSFSTICHGSAKFKEAPVETQLAHLYGSTTRRAYDRGAYMRQRKVLMQWWADKCHALRTVAESIATDSRSGAKRN